MQRIVLELHVIKQYVLLGSMGQGSRRREVFVLEKMQEEPNAWVRNTCGNINSREKLFSTYWVPRTMPSQISHVILRTTLWNQCYHPQFTQVVNSKAGTRIQMLAGWLQSPCFSPLHLLYGKWEYCECTQLKLRGVLVMNGKIRSMIRDYGKLWKPDKEPVKFFIKNFFS